MLVLCCLLQALLDGLDEAQELLQAALRVRQRYMSVSQQEFCRTTERMLNGVLPPSSSFCSMSSQDFSIRFTVDGDVKKQWSENHYLICSSIIVIVYAYRLTVVPELWHIQHSI